MNVGSAGEDPALGAFSGGLLAVHAHPDDETLSTGGLIATFAAAGLPVCVVTCTRGERGEVLALPGTTSEGLAGLEGDGPALGAHRETELAAALDRLAGADGAVGHTFLDALPGVYAQVDGVVNPWSAPGGGLVSRPGVGRAVVSGGGQAATPDAGPAATSDTGQVSPTPRGPERYEDSGMAWVAPGVAGPAPGSPPTAFARVPLDDPAGRLALLIRARRPAVVATYEPGGGYGHPDHVRAHAVTVRALELAADPEWVPGTDARAPRTEGVPVRGAGPVADGERTEGVPVRGGGPVADGERADGVPVGRGGPVADVEGPDGVPVRAGGPAADVERADGAVVRGGEPPGGVGRRGEPWAGAELWQAVAPAAQVRAARETLAALPEARALAARHGLALPDPHEDLPPFAREDLPPFAREDLPPFARGDLPGWVAGCRAVGGSDRRAGDGLPIARTGEVAVVDVRAVLGRVVAGLRAHATQVQHADALPEAVDGVAGWYALSNAVLAPILTTETYAVAAAIPFEA